MSSPSALARTRSLSARETAQLAALRVAAAEDFNANFQAICESDHPLPAEARHLATRLHELLQRFAGAARMASQAVVDQLQNAARMRDSVAGGAAQSEQPAGAGERLEGKDPAAVLAESMEISGSAEGFGDLHLGHLVCDVEEGGDALSHSQSLAEAELRGASALRSTLGFSRLRSPLLAVVHDRGYIVRVAADAPLSWNALSLATDARGRASGTEDELLQLAERLARRLNLARHTVAVDRGVAAAATIARTKTQARRQASLPLRTQTTSLRKLTSSRAPVLHSWLAGPVEACRGRDGRCYLQHLDALLPPLPAGVDGEDAASVRPPGRMRVEFLRLYCSELPMSADAGTSWAAPEDEDRDQRVCHAVLDTLRNRAVPEAARRLQDLAAERRQGRSAEDHSLHNLLHLQGSPVSRALHDCGVNIRHLGLVWRCLALGDAEEKKDAANASGGGAALALAEMAARTLKRLWRGVQLLAGLPLAGAAATGANIANGSGSGGGGDAWEVRVAELHALLLRELQGRWVGADAWRTFVAASLLSHPASSLTTALWAPDGLLERGILFKFALRKGSALPLHKLRETWQREWCEAWASAFMTATPPHADAALEGWAAQVASSAPPPAKVKLAGPPAWEEFAHGERRLQAELQGIRAAAAQASGNELARRRRVALHELISLYTEWRRVTARAGHEQPLLEAVEELLQLGEQPALSDADRAYDLHLISLALYTIDRFDDARTFAQRGVALRDKAAAFEADLSFALNNLGVVHYAQGAYDEAGRTLERAVVLKERAFGGEHWFVAVSLSNLALVRLALAQFGEAARHFKRAFEIAAATLSTQHPESVKLAWARPSARGAAGPKGEAQEAVEEAMRLSQHASAVSELRLADMLLAVANMLAGTAHDHSGALQLFERVVAIQKSCHGPEQPAVALALLELGRQLDRMNQKDEALNVFHSALLIAERECGAVSLPVASALAALGKCAVDSDMEPNEAVRALERALGIRKRVLGNEHPEVAAVHFALALAFERAGDLPRAVAEADRCSAACAARLGAEHHLTRTAMGLRDRMAIACGMRQPGAPGAVVRGGAGRRGPCAIA
jgi:tetratricopeptide (TPR) repeat protein